MERLEIAQGWLGELLPDGWPIRTSTLITGPGGSGKPLVGSVVAGNWLRGGGSVVFMSLQYPDPKFISSGVKKLTGVDVDEFRGRVAFLEFDPAHEGLEEVGEDRLRGNLVIPGIWEEGIERGCSLVSDEGSGILVLGSALNLLLFSPTYGSEVLERMKRTIRDDRRRTYLFSVSSSAKADMIRELEEVADNLLVSHSTKHPFRIYLRIERMPGVAYAESEVKLPIASDTLEEIRTVADYSRKRIIPQVSEI